MTGQVDTPAVGRVGKLGRLAARGALVTMSGQVLRLVIQTAAIVLLARFLTPEDYGLLAMVVAIVGVGEVFRDFGLSSAAVQADRLDSEQQSNLFWVNTLIGACLTAIVIASAPLIASLYHEPRLTLVAQAVSVTFLLNGLATQPKARLLRSLRFKAVTGADIAGLAAGATAGLGAAVAGAGYWALVLQQVVQALVSSIIVCAFARWRPGRYRRGVAMGGLYRFGTSYALTQLLGYASRNVDSIVIGAKFGARDLGIYNRAFQLLTLPLNQINGPATSVALPVLSRLQGQTQRFGSFLLRGQAGLLHVVLLVFALSSAQAPALVGIALGPQWTQAVPLFQILALAGAFQTASFVTYWCFLALGLVKQNLFFSLATRPFLILAIVAGVQFGTVGVAWAYAGGVALLWPAGLIWLHLLHTQVPVGALAANGTALLLVYGLVGVASWTVTNLSGIENAWLQLVVGLSVGSLVIVLFFSTVSWYRTSLKELYVTMRSAIRGGPQSMAEIAS